MKIALVQLHSTPDKEKNIKKALGFAHKAISNNAVFILFPETFNIRAEHLNKKKTLQVAENIPGPSTKPFMQLAEEKRVYILLGSLLEKKKDKIYNTSVLVGPNGKIIVRYQKINLFKAVVGKKAIDEAIKISKGRNLITAKIRNMKAGCAICYDIRFPEMFKAYRKKGVNVFLVPSSFTYETGKAHWEVLLRARAIENFSYVLAPNQVGQTQQGVKLYGNSMVVDPWGSIVRRASTKKEEILYATLDFDRIEKTKKKLPGMK